MSAWGNAARRKGWLEASKIFLFVGFPIGFTILQAQPGVMGFIVRDREYVRFPPGPDKEGYEPKAQPSKDDTGTKQGPMVSVMRLVCRRF